MNIQSVSVSGSVKRLNFGMDLGPILERQGERLMLVYGDMPLPLTLDA